MSKEILADVDQDQIRIGVLGTGNWWNIMWKRLMKKE